MFWLRHTLKPLEQGFALLNHVPSPRDFALFADEISEETDFYISVYMGTGFVSVPVWFKCTLYGAPKQYVFIIDSKLLFYAEVVGDF